MPGAADRSYGIQVAKLAGLPPRVIERAKVVLAELEAEGRGKPARGFDDLPLFQSSYRTPPREQPASDPLEPVIAALSALHPDEMSPRQAMDALYALKAKLAGAKEQKG
jgi:DNA mismatch repair protein MutS